MARQFDFTGQSGTAYRYTRLEDGQLMWPSGGNFLYVRQGDEGPQVVYAGETESLFRGYHDKWDRARAAHGATDIYLRLNISGSVRRAEQEDIVARHQPAMNVESGEGTEKPARPKRAPRKAKG
jgi:hypothetical protein